jgi:hypothetical protein
MSYISRTNSHTGVTESSSTANNSTHVNFNYKPVTYATSPFKSSVSSNYNLSKNTPNYTFVAANNNGPSTHVIKTASSLNNFSTHNSSMLHPNTTVDRDIDRSKTPVNNYTTSTLSTDQDREKYKNNSITPSTLSKMSTPEYVKVCEYITSI